MIFRNQYTLTIGQYEIMEITGDRNVLCMLPFKMPKKWLDNAYKRLMSDYNSKSNESQLQRLIESDFQRIKVGEKIIFLDSLCELIKAYGIIGETSKELESIYKLKYGKIPVTKEDFEKPFKDKIRLIEKAELYFADEQPKKVDIKKLIRNIELILETKIRDDKFYLLSSYIEEASNKKTNGRD